jgi:hypothetical protein
MFRSRRYRRAGLAGPACLALSGGATDLFSSRTFASPLHCWYAQPVHGTVEMEAWGTARSDSRG